MKKRPQIGLYFSNSDLQAGFIDVTQHINSISARASSCQERSFGKTDGTACCLDTTHCDNRFFSNKAG
ncbi:MAG: hypothetical protein ACRYGK_15465 [Janthinobacterium lividum]